MTQLQSVDPVEMATAATGKKSRAKDKQLPAITVAERFKEYVGRFVTTSREKKAAEALAATARAELLTWAKGEFVKRLIQKQFGNFLMTNGTAEIQFTVQARGKSFGEQEKKTLVEGFGDEAAKLLESGADVQLNLDVWEVHRETLVGALNAVDAKGNRLVDDSILKALFYRPMKIKSTVFEDAVTLAKGDEAKLARLLFDELDLTCSLGAK